MRFFLESMCRAMLCGIVFVPAFTVGCSSARSADGAEGGENAESAESELRALKSNEIVGTIQFGQTVGPLAYTEQPLYRALAFNGTKGASVDIWVRSSDGDARAWLTSSSFSTLAANDDASLGDRDAHLVKTLSKTGTYYIVWREKNREDATFRVSLNAPPAGPPPAGPPPAGPPPGPGVDPFAAWMGGPLVATGTCQQQEVEPYSCVPGWPGRDANGCCIASYPIASLPSTVAFQLTKLSEGSHELSATACTIVNATCAITATAKEDATNALRNPNASLKSTSFYPYMGSLAASVMPDGTLTVGYSGTASYYPGRCGLGTRYLSCTWKAP